MSDGIPSTSILNNILADINAVIPNFSSLVASYRLLVGASEEVGRTPGVPEEIFRRAVVRYDRAGTLIDILLELLCCKIKYSSDFLKITCAPIDLFQLVANNSLADYTPNVTGEQILQLELIRRALDCACPDGSCFGPPPAGIAKPPPKPPEPQSPPAPSASPASPLPESSTAPPAFESIWPPCPPPFKKNGEGDFAPELQPESVKTVVEVGTEAEIIITSPLRPKHINVGEGAKNKHNKALNQQKGKSK